MNRIIKFRAWDEERKEYLSAGCVSIEIHRGRNPINKIILDKNYEGYEKRFILEQYTGFKDSGNTGKKIYHNDIFPKGGIVKWVWGGWCVKFPTYIISLYEYIYNDMHRKVIGNIHENKELLQEGKQHGNYN